MGPIADHGAGVDARLEFVAGTKTVFGCAGSVANAIVDPGLVGIDDDWDQGLTEFDGALLASGKGEVAGLNLFTQDEVEHHVVHDKWPEFFHKIEYKRWTTVFEGVETANVGIQANPVGNCLDIFL